MTEESHKIYPTLIAGYGRRLNCTPKEAVLFMLRRNTKMQPTELLRLLCDLTMPPFKDNEIKEAFHKMIEDGIIELTPDRYLQEITNG